ncbi:MAG TPA: Ig-like domain-containing protein [Blastocatellia bacterium]|nr:Ig-like domain-containing protein [Blastocatellia bacterium]
MPRLTRGALRMIPLLTLLTLTAPAWAQEAQNNSTAASAVKTVSVTPAIAEAEVGQQVKFTAAGLDAGGKATDQKATVWFAVPGDVAAVDETGTARLFAPGEVRVGALVGGKPGFAKLVIKPARVTRLEITGLNAPLVAGGTMKLTARAIGANGDPRTDVMFAWSSDNPSVAAVDAAGLVTGVAPGKAKLVAKAEGATGETMIEIVKSNVRNLSIEPRTMNARTGDVIHFAAQAKDSRNAMVKNASVRWAVSGEGATIESDGSFVAERPGTYVITATVGEQASAASVVVGPRNSERELELVGRIRLKDIQAAEEWLFGNYAYVSTIWDQVQVYDISDPASPKLSDTVKVDARIVNDVSVTADGKIGVLTREASSSRKDGIVFLDTSDPAHPKVISEYTATVTGGVHSAYIDGHYVYLTDDATGSMRVIDFQDVKNPKEVARWQVELRDPKLANPSRTGQFTDGRYLHDVQVKDGLAYLAYWRDGLVILDVGNGVKGGSPENPKLVSQLRFNHNELYGNGWLAGTHEVYRYKNYVFVGDEVLPDMFNIYGKERIAARGVLHVVDVSDILNPRKVAEYAVPEGGAHNVWVKDDILVMGYYGGGGRVLDVSGELRGDLYRQGREIARLWTGDPQGFRPNVPFTWGARHHNGLIFFNDINSGVWIMKLGKPRQKGSTTAPGY